MVSLLNALGYVAAVAAFLFVTLSLGEIHSRRGQTVGCRLTQQVSS